MPVLPLWTRRGVVLPPDGLGSGWSPHRQMPTPLDLGGGKVALFYSSRDRQNRSHVFRADLAAGETWQVTALSSEPALAPGPPGAFDAAGVMPTALVAGPREIWMYYIGWTVRADVPYHNSIGIVRSTDGGQSFHRFLPGPVVSTGPYEPYFCGTAEVLRDGAEWRMWYMSATGWRDVAGRMEPRYHIKQATSQDGILWQHGTDVAVDYLSDDEGGIARATVLRRGSDWWMWFCHRGIDVYRGTGPNAYRLGAAWSPDGRSWQRLAGQEVFADRPGADSFDAHMQCYPAVFEYDGKTWMFYNGSDFGQTGIGCATLANAAGDV